MQKNWMSLAISGLSTVALSAVLVACGGDNDEPVASVPDADKFFNRTATFTVCSQIGASCEADAVTAAEIVAASVDGMTLVYSNSPKGRSASSTSAT